MFKIIALATAVSAWPDAHGDEYIAKSAAEKSDFLWEQITSNDHSGNYLSLPDVLVENMKDTFDTPGDDMPCYWDGCRWKDIHCVGVVSKVKFVTENNPFSGVFQGADYGFIRHSTALPYDKDGDSITPGLGLKLLRDGVDSSNLVAMFSVDGQKDWNFFGNDWSNHIPPIESAFLTPVALKFYSETNWIQVVGLSNFADYDQSGTATYLNFPFQLRFEPSPDF